MFFTFIRIFEVENHLYIYICTYIQYYFQFTYVISLCKLVIFIPIRVYVVNHLKNAKKKNSIFKGG